MITFSQQELNTIIIKFTHSLFIIIHLVFLLMFGYIKNPISTQSLSSNIIIYNIIYSISYFLPIDLNFCCYLQTFTQLLSLFGLFFTLTTIPLSYHFQYANSKTFNDNLKFQFQITFPLILSTFLLLIGKPSISTREYTCSLSISYTQYIIPSLITLITVVYMTILILYVQRRNNLHRRQNTYKSHYLIKSTICICVLFVYFQFMHWFTLFYLKEKYVMLGVLESVDILLRGSCVFVLGMKKDMCYELLEILCCMKGDDFHFVELETGPVLPPKTM